ncbi:MAG: hypothetical protein ABIT64_02190, partial [Lysobacteraceae bacterium]
MYTGKTMLAPRRRMPFLGALQLGALFLFSLAGLSWSAGASAQAAMTVSKTLTSNADGDVNFEVTVGDVLTYTVTATNNGSVVLTNVMVTDPLTSPNSISCASVAVGAACTLAGTYTVTAADESAGNINNMGSATSNEIPGPVTSALRTPVATRTTAMGLEKLLRSYADNDSNGVVSVGDTLTYHVRIRNTGTAPLTNVVVSDSLISPNSTTCATVTYGTLCTLIGTYTVTAADGSNGSISNTGSATANEIPGPMTTTYNVAVGTNSYALVYTLHSDHVETDNDGNGLITVGDAVHIQVTVRNTGNQTLTNVVVSDPLLSPSSVTCPTLAIGDFCGFGPSPALYIVTAADEVAGSITDTASVTSNEVPGPQVSTFVVPVATRSTTMTLTKTYQGIATDADGNGQVTVGDTLRYHLQLQNTGTQLLTNVVISDPRLSPGSVNCGTVNNGGGCSFDGTYVVTTADQTA